MLTACPYTFKSLMEKRALLNEIPTDEQIVLVNNLLFIIELIIYCNKFDSSFINSIFFVSRMDLNLRDTFRAAQSSLPLNLLNIFMNVKNFLNNISMIYLNSKKIN